MKLKDLESGMIVIHRNNSMSIVMKTKKREYLQLIELDNQGRITFKPNAMLNSLESYTVDMRFSRDGLLLKDWDVMKIYVPHINQFSRAEFNKYLHVYEREMTLDDLKDGRIVRYRDGTFAIVMRDGEGTGFLYLQRIRILAPEVNFDLIDVWNCLNEHDEKLNNHYKKNLDIIEVYKPDFTGACRLINFSLVKGKEEL